MPVLLLALVLTTAVPPAQEGIPSAVRTAADRITADQLKRDLDYLSSDELKGRNTDSPGYDMAADYIAKRLQRAGLKPFGDEGTFYQRYVMREIQADGDAAHIEIDGKRLRFGDDFVLRSLSGAMSGPKQVVYVGHGWTIAGQQIDPYVGVDVKGKLVVVHGPRALPKGVEIPQLGRVNIGGSPPVLEAERRGAAGIIFIPQASVTDWEQMRGQNLNRRELEPSVPSAYAAPTVTSVMLSRQATDALMTGEKIAGADLLALGDKQEYPPSFELRKSVTIHVPLSATTDRRPYNVVALLEGSDPALKDEYITIESHLDGAVGSRTVDGDSIYNSADDNASGSAGNLAIAEVMAAGPRPKRSIIFIWDSGEERGLWGTRYFVSRPPVPLDKIVTHINIDMIGANRAIDPAPTPRTTGPNEIFLLGPRVLSAQAESLLHSVNNAYLKMTLNQDNDRADSEYFYPRTDAGPFLERGILTIGFTSGNHNRYHLPADEAKFLDPKKMETTARTIFVSAWMLADAKERMRIDRAVPPSVLRYQH
jgi:hypothetical protein